MKYLFDLQILRQKILKITCTSWTLIAFKVKYANFTDSLSTLENLKRRHFNRKTEMTLFATIPVVGSYDI